VLIFLRNGSKNQPEGTAVVGLENLAKAGGYGHHLVAGDRDTLEEISKHSKLSEQARAFYRRMALELTQIGHSIRTFDRINVDASDSSIFPVGDYIPAGVFADIDYCEKSQLLTENITDYEVLTIFARMRLSEFVKGMSLSLRAVHGGGSTTPQMLEHLHDVPGGPVLCVVDSDRKYDGGALGCTALSTRRKFKNLRKKWRINLYILDARELENLIPNRVRLAACQSLSVDAQKELALLYQMNEKYMLYCCLKDGDSTCRLLSSVLSKRQYDHITKIGQMKVPGLKSLEKCGTCPYEDGCVATPGLGSNFLQRVSSALKEGAICSADEWPSELKKLVDMVIQLGISQPIIRV